MKGLVSKGPFFKIIDFHFLISLGSIHCKLQNDIDIIHILFLVIEKSDFQFQISVQKGPLSEKALLILTFM